MLNNRQLKEKYKSVVEDYEKSPSTFNTFFLGAIEVRVEYDDFEEIKELFRLRKILKDEQKRG